MSTTSRMTIAWDRGDQIGLLPEDSSVVEADQLMTIYWRALTTPTFFEYDPTDLIVTPGAGEEVVAPGGPVEEAGGGGSSSSSSSSSGGGGGGQGGGSPGPFGPPELFVAHRRSLEMVLEDGLFLQIHAPAPARVRAVLEVTVKGAGKKKQTVNLTKPLTAEIGTEPRRLTLHPSRAGRMLLNRLEGSVATTLVLIVNYGGGQAPLTITRGVRVLGG